MSLRLWAGLVISVVLLALPASASTPAPQVTDACGDANSRYDYNGQGSELEANRAYLDLASGSVRTLFDAEGHDIGVTVAITVCGAVDAANGSYGIGWSYAGRCTGDLLWNLAGRDAPRDGEGVQGFLNMADGAKGELVETCYSQPESPLDSGSDEIYRHQLDAESIRFEGDTLTFTLLRADLPAAAAQRFAKDTVWSDIGAVSTDQASGLWAGYGDTEGNRGNLYLRTDLALSDAVYVVGEE